MATIQEITEEATSKYADLGWIKIHYNEAGSGDPPVILLHGGGLGASSWSNFVLNIPVFAEHFRVLAVDAPSYGKSDSYVATEPRTSVNARAVKDLMDNLGIEKASLVGNSMGGGTALTFAVDYPERLEKMILMGSAGGGTPMFSQNPTEGIKALMAVFQDQSFENFRKMFDLMLYDGSTVPDEVLRARIASVNQNHLKAFRESAGAAFQRNLVLDLPDVKTPTLITHGRDDRVVPMEGSVSLLAMLPNSQLHVFNQCGHWVQYEHASYFNRLVLDFLQHDD